MFLAFALLIVPFKTLTLAGKGVQLHVFLCTNAKIPHALYNSPLEFAVDLHAGMQWSL